MQISPPSAHPQTPRFPSSARMLILDDERFDRHRLQRLSSGLPVSMHLETADSLAKLAVLLQNDSFDLIFVDYKLPDGTGLEALEMIRQCPRNCTAATLMVTGLLRSDVTAQARAAGCHDILIKDALTPTDFSNAVADALRSTLPDIPHASATYTTEQVQTLLQSAKQDVAHEMKPLVSRLLRQLRNLRDMPAEVRLESLQTADASCTSLWEYLVAVERKEHSLPPPLGAVQTTKRAASPTRKPPSPFSRMN